MSEFKFACPVCGQHITSNTEASGRQMQCPTCFQKIVAPQAPASGETKFILAGKTAQKPRALPSEDASTTARASNAWSGWAGVALAVVAISVLAGGAYFLQDWRSRNKNVPPSQTNAPIAQVPVPTSFGWTLNLKDVAFPEAPVAGRIHGSGFVAQKVTLEGETLVFRHTNRTGLGFAVSLFARHSEDLAGKVVLVTPERQPPLPRVVLRWKNEQKHNQTESIPSGYAMKLSFGHVEEDSLAGRIYLCLPDEAKSFAAGTFRAEIRKTGGKPHTPEAKQPEPAGSKPAGK